MKLEHDYVNSLQNLITLNDLCNLISKGKHLDSLIPLYNQSLSSLKQLPTYNQRYYFPDKYLDKNIIPYKSPLTPIRKQFDFSICIINGHIRSLNQKEKFEEIKQQIKLIVTMTNDLTKKFLNK